MSTKTTSSKQLPMKRRGSRHASPEVRKQQIIKATIECLSKYGFHLTTTEMIGQVAGLSKGSIYRFFKSKDELLLAILDDWNDKIAEKTNKESIQKPLIKQLYDSCFIHIEILSQKPELLPIWGEFLIHPITRKMIKEFHLTARKELSKIIREGVKSGVFREVAPMQYADTLISLLEGTMIVAVANPEINIRKKFKSQWSVIEKSLLPPDTK